MKKHFLKAAFLSLALVLGLSSCSVEDDGDLGANANLNGANGAQDTNTSPVFLIIDEESIDNGNEPNNFSETDVNDQLADIGLRRQLRFFEENVGKTIDLFTGQVGDEGWHAPKTILSSWKNTGPTNKGLQNFLFPGPGLGGGEDDREVLLDEIPDVIPLRATALAMLVGQTVFAVVYDSDVSTNYDPIKANLQGSNLGIVAFRVLEVKERRDGSDADLPRVTISILDANRLKDGALYLFSNAPEPRSSSEPEDTVPPVEVNPIILELAD
jgi:hypothetical protein